MRGAAVAAAGASVATAAGASVATTGASVATGAFAQAANIIESTSTTANTLKSLFNFIFLLLVYNP
jgi:hypothetical protein